MAANKTKRSIHLAQPQPQQNQPQQAQHPVQNPEPTEPQPVRSHVYRTIADMNGGFEHVMEALQTLERIKRLPAPSLNGIKNQIARIRAEANRDLMAVLSERELANVGHFQSLCLEPPAKP
jgi:hypothetical protein